MSIKTIDLFCGIGGLTHGFVKEDINVVAGYDIDLSCKYPFEANNKAEFIRKDIRDVSSEEINAHFEGATVKILVGCAPCQPFSTYAVKSLDNKEEARKAKWGLLYEFARLIKECKPDIVSMENVPGLAKNDKVGVFRDFLNTLYEEEYQVDCKIVYCPDYGIPQRRKRLVLLASKLGKITLIQPTHSPGSYKTVDQTIGHLTELESGEVCDTDPIHRSMKLTDVNLARIRQSVQGGTWRDWDEDLRLECHKKSTGKTYASVYGRMKGDEPAPTMTTFCIGVGNGRFVHPTQDRGITLREAALFQTFPETYEFIKPGAKLSLSGLSTHIGNAVPVDLGRAIAKSIKFHLMNYEHQENNRPRHN